MRIDDNDDVDHLDFVLSHPPLETPPPKKAKTRIMTVCGTLHDSKNSKRGVNVARVFLDSDTSKHYVAKIYDGLDFPLTDSCYDCMYVADLCYSRETAAYRRMPKSFRGSIVPRYHGSWTFSIDTDRPGVRRWVRMILIELIEGDSILDLILRAQGYGSRSSYITAVDSNEYRADKIDYSLLPPEPERLDILAAVLETQTILLRAGIRHNDFATRNVLIRRADKRVVLIDFDSAYASKELGERNSMHLPVNPIQNFWSENFGAYDFRHWVPQSWRSSTYFSKAWLCNRWGVSRDYQPLDDFFLERHGRYLVKHNLLPHLKGRIEEMWDKCPEPYEVGDETEPEEEEDEEEQGGNGVL